MSPQWCIQVFTRYVPSEESIQLWGAQRPTVTFKAARVIDMDTEKIQDRRNHPNFNRGVNANAVSSAHRQFQPIQASKDFHHNNIAVIGYYSGFNIIFPTVPPRVTRYMDCLYKMLHNYVLEKVLITLMPTKVGELIWVLLPDTWRFVMEFLIYLRL